MDKERPIYAIDTNVLIDYDGIIPSLDGKSATPSEPTVDLTHAHLVIPSVVIRELSSFKTEKSERGKIARAVLKRIREVFESDLKAMHDMYHLEASVRIGDQLISVLPVHKDFAKGIPFQPADADMDGQIILTAMTAEYLLNDMKVDGTEVGGFAIDDEGREWIHKKSEWSDQPDVLRKKLSTRTILLTNDNGLAIRARERGIQTKRYGHKCRAPYTGRRDIEVPEEMLMDFLTADSISREAFEQMMPEQPRLVANEFLVMSCRNQDGELPDYVQDDPYFERIGRYDKETDTIQHLRYAYRFPVTPKNPGQAIYAEALMNPKFAAVICTGPAGSGKTYMPTVYGYTACQIGHYIGVMAVPCESQSKIGSLPGDLEEKMNPDVQPLKNALHNYLLHEDRVFRKELEYFQAHGAKPQQANRQSGDNTDNQDESSLEVRLMKQVEAIWRNWFTSVPIAVARGRDFAYKLAIYDEFQDQSITQADTLIKRLGEEGKIVLAGDIQQIHAAYLDQFNNGLVYASKLFFNSPMVAQVCFTEAEVVRHPLVQFIAQKQRQETENRLKNAEQ